MIRQSQAPTILLTRPIAQSERFSAELSAALGEVAIVISPLMTTEFLYPPLPVRSFSAVIFTSETGVLAATRLGGPLLLPGKAFCVGRRTATVARAAGFEAVSADGDSTALLGLLVKDADAPLLLLRGEDSAGDVADHLNSAGLETVSITVYRQKPQPLTVEATTVLRATAPVILPLFSPRSAQLAAAEVAHISATAPILIAALSDAVAKNLGNLHPKSCQIAIRPDSAAMVKAVAALIGISRAS